MAFGISAATFHFTHVRLAATFRVVDDVSANKPIGGTCSARHP